MRKFSLCDLKDYLVHVWVDHYKNSRGQGLTLFIAAPKISLRLSEFVFRINKAIDVLRFKKQKTKQQYVLFIETVLSFRYHRPFHIRQASMAAPRGLT